MRRKKRVFASNYLLSLNLNESKHVRSYKAMQRESLGASQDYFITNSVMRLDMMEFLSFEQTAGSNTVSTYQVSSVSIRSYKLGQGDI